MKEVPAREGLNEIKQYINLTQLCKDVGKKSPWFHQCLSRANVGYGSYIQHFKEEDVAKLNDTLHQWAESILRDIRKLPDEEDKEKRNEFRHTIKDITYYLRSAILSDAAGIHRQKWTEFMTLVDRRTRLWFKPHHIKAIKDEAKRIAELLRDTELTYEPLDAE